MDGGKGPSCLPVAPLVKNPPLHLIDLAACVSRTGLTLLLSVPAVVNEQACFCYNDNVQLF